MNIMYATDDGYVEIMAVSIKSLLESNRAQQISLYIVTDNISSENKYKLNKMISETGATLFFIEKPDIRKLLNVDLKTLRWSDSAYSRLFLKLIFEKEYPDVNKLLYVDCDTIITDSLEDLWNTDISDYLGAACLECMSNGHKRILGTKPNDNYINTGMILFNVDRWIKECVDEIMIDYIRKHKGKTEYVDQGVINGTISNRLCIVSPKYNLTCLAYDFTYEEMIIYRKPEFGYEKDEWNQAIDKPAIVHFTTSFLSIRPWYEGSKHPYAFMWRQVHERTPWKGYEYRILKNRKSHECKERIFRKLPRRLAVCVAGFLHSYIKPFVFLMK